MTRAEDALTIDTTAIDVALPDGSGLRLTGPELQHLTAVRAAVADHRQNGDPAALQRGLVAARALVASLPGFSDERPPRLDDLRALAEGVSELGDLLTAAADEAQRAVGASCAALWTTLGLVSAPPRWTAAEHAAARMVFACACAPAPPGSEWLQASLRRLSAGQVAGLMCAELCHREAVWLRALGGRYGSLRHRCAPRTPYRSRGLCDLLRDDADCRAAVVARLQHWAVAGARLDELADELEAAVVHARTPSRLA